ncbi:beta/gamma crystallin domain-containing protein [Micromonospora sp. NPDC049900]|uniref:beta/gamma crystallin domain-containing protein n=1 Tax=unclassified Micromonospora TaxID=2617518 RepID=UPI0037AA2A75
MRVNLKKVAAGALAAVAVTFALPANPAYAINRVDCAGRTDLLAVSYETSSGIGSTQCFANAGAVAVNIGKVHRVNSGNNKVTVNYEYAGRYHSTTLEKQRYLNFAAVRVYELRIW